MRLPLPLAFSLLASLAVPAVGIAAEAPPPGVAVVELFTSEGCSSCPAADDVLAAEAAAPKAGVLLLAYHVDYWDRLGWKDPYASPAASERQYAYAKALGCRVYTPQALVNGRSEIVGSDAASLQAAIARELERPASARVDLITAWSGKDCTATCTVAALDAKAPAPASLTVALVEDALSDAVASGENAGRTLTHQRVVRESRSVPLAKSIAPLAFALPKGAVAEHLRVIAYAQDAKRAVMGAAESPWSAPAPAKGAAPTKGTDPAKVTVPAKGAAPAKERQAP